jgi:hypothetical protein
MPTVVAATTARPRTVWRMPTTLAGAGLRAVMRWTATTPATETAPAPTAGSTAVAVAATARAARSATIRSLGADGRWWRRAIWARTWGMAVVARLARISQTAMASAGECPAARRIMAETEQMP